MTATAVLFGDPRQAGACVGVDPDLFFPERGGSTREAKAVCRGCDVREPCLAYALRNGEKFGIWGGTSERERRRMKRTTLRQVASGERHAQIIRLARRTLPGDERVGELPAATIASTVGCTTTVVYDVLRAASARGEWLPPLRVTTNGKVRVSTRATSKRGE